MNTLFHLTAEIAHCTQDTGNTICLPFPSRWPLGLLPFGAIRNHLSQQFHP